MEIISEDIFLPEFQTLEDIKCPNCASHGMLLFYEVKEVPTNSCIMLSSHQEALDYPRGDASLGFCPACSFISNVSFQPKLTEYSGRYEETQGFSETFNKFHYDLVNKLIDRHGLHNKKIIEIGCGKGEFLSLLCEIGGNQGFGFDPAFLEERHVSHASGQVSFIKDFYSEKYSQYQGDFIACKMTLEHIHNPLEFMKIIRRSIGNKLDTVLFIQVPDATRIIKDCAFEDIYYEHCSYFTPGSISSLFKKSGFEIIHLETTYNSQYLTVEARPVQGDVPETQDTDEYHLRAYLSGFQEKFKEKLLYWREKLHEIHSQHQKIVLWGSGSKGVAFLTTLKITDEIEYAVDINPFRHGYYMAGTGQKIVAPNFLIEYQPDFVLIMNPIYFDEIQRDLASMDLSPEILAI